MSDIGLQLIKCESSPGCWLQFHVGLNAHKRPRQKNDVSVPTSRLSEWLPISPFFQYYDKYPVPFDTSWVCDSMRSRALFFAICIDG